MRTGYISYNLTRMAGIQAFVFPTIECEWDGFHLADVYLSVLYYDEFSLLDGDSAIDRHGDYMAAAMFGQARNLPYFALFMYEQELGEQEFDIELRSNATKVRRLALSFWLHKRGLLFNPLDCIIYARNDNVNMRRLQRLGREPLDYLSHASFGYVVNTADIQEIEHIYYLLGANDKARGFSRLEFAIMLFEECHDVTMAYAERALMLIATVDCLIDGAWHLFREYGCGQGDMVGEAEDLERIRDRVAHGESIALSEYESIEDIARTLIKQTLATVVYAEEQVDNITDTVRDGIKRKAGATGINKHDNVAYKRYEIDKELTEEEMARRCKDGRVEARHLVVRQLKSGEYRVVMEEFGINDAN